MMTSLSTTSCFGGTQDPPVTQDSVKCFFCFQDKVALTEDDNWSVESTHSLLPLMEKMFSLQLPELNRDEDLFFCTDCAKTWTDLSKGWVKMQRIKDLTNTLRKKLAAKIQESILESQLLELEPSGDLFLYLRTQIFSSK